MKKLSDILVVSDMDGTLLSSRKVISDADLAAIHLFTQLGGNFSIATGRVVESVSKYQKLLPYLSPTITSGGCVVYDFKNNTMLQNWVLPIKIGMRALGEIRVRFPDIGIVVMAGDAKVYAVKTSRETQVLFSDENLNYYMRQPADLPKAWNKILFAAPKAALKELSEFVKMRQYGGVYFVNTSETYFEMMPQGVDKSTEIEAICRLVGVTPKNTIVIGDYYNDLELMRAVGYSVAVENAADEVLEAADEVTGQNNFSGVGQYLYKLIKKHDQ